MLLDLFLNNQLARTHQDAAALLSPSPEQQPQFSGTARQEYARCLPFYGRRKERHLAAWQALPDCRLFQ